jgi:hypothetical protein
MHETHLFKNLIAYLHEEERVSCRRIEKIHVELSDFGGLSQEHFMEHYLAGCAGTPWEHVALEFTRVPYGPEFAITRIDYADDLRADHARAITRSRQ